MEGVSLRAYSRHRGVSLRAVQKAIQSGRITTTAEGKIDIAAADARWDRNTAPRPSSLPLPSARQQHPDLSEAIKTDTAVPPGLDYSRARAVRENYMARLAKIEFEERSGKLISRDEVKVAAFNRFRVFRDRMLNIPDRVAAVLAAEHDSRSVHDILSAEIRKALEEFADAPNGG